MQQQPDITEVFRYERKFLVKDVPAKEIELMLKLHAACFKEIYSQRTINNIYFDTLGFNNYYDNVEGDRERWKARIRWYGEQFGEITKPVLEFKIKKGLLGKKESYRLAPFNLDRSFSMAAISEALGKSELPDDIRDLLLSLKPTLLNRYKRKYFLSFDKRFRVTVDTDLTYFMISTCGNTFLNRSVDHSTVVVELKYRHEADPVADSISNLFPFMLTKSSKYLQGLERVLM
jgi:SPX domain protein involved in polyphosphate accumulation